MRRRMANAPEASSAASSILLPPRSIPIRKVDMREPQCGPRTIARSALQPRAELEVPRVVGDFLDGIHAILQRERGHRDRVGERRDLEAREHPAAPAMPQAVEADAEAAGR